MMNRKQQGLTLVEVLIAIVIVGILAGVAIPTYQNTVSKSRRADGIALAMGLAAREERHFMQYGTYTTDITGATGLNAPAESSEGFYTAAVAACGGGTIATCFTVMVTAKGSQAKHDTSCNTLTITHTGIRAASNAGGEANGDCW
jgi:type IV pilus assembly protein PilE